MKNILLALLILLNTLGFSQTKIYEVPKAKDAVWITRPNGNIVFYIKKAENVIEISPKGKIISEYKYDHIISKMMYRSPSFVSSPDSKHLYVVNPLFDVEFDYILSKLENGKSKEVLTTASDKTVIGDIVDIFCDDENLYILSTEKVNKFKVFSLFSINHKSHLVTELSKEFHTNELRFTGTNYGNEPGGRYVGQNKNSIFINLTNPSANDEYFSFSIIEINKSNGTTSNHSIDLKADDNKKLGPIHFKHHKSTAQNNLKIQSSFFTTTSGSGYSYSYLLPSEIGQISISNDTINIIGILAEVDDKRQNLTLKNFYSINYSVKSKNQTTSISKLNNFKVEIALAANLSSPNKCFSIERTDSRIYFERESHGGLSGKTYTTTILEGELTDNKLSKIKFTETKGKTGNPKRFKEIGVDPSKFDISKLDMGTEVYPTVFSTMDKKTFTLYSIK